jgi:hypothetical protein
LSRIKPQCFTLREKKTVDNDGGWSAEQIDGDWREALNELAQPSGPPRKDSAT